MNVEQQIFKNGSTTYYFSSKFFPEPMRSDVFKLYSFVRVADNYVDEQPAQPKKLRALERAWHAGWNNPNFDITVSQRDSVDVRVVKNMVDVARRYDFKPEWIDAFFSAMKADIHPKPYKTIEDVLVYIHGSAEVIGLMMARIMGLPEPAMKAAAMQGRAMQFINFIRDVTEDNTLGRQYIPADDLHIFGLKDLSQASAKANPKAFRDLLRFELKRYSRWQREAKKGFRFIPRRYRIPLRTAVDMYNWTGRQIAHDPMVVYKRKVKPTKEHVIVRAILRIFYA